MFADAQGSKNDVGVGGIANVVEARAGCGGETEVLRNYRERGCTCSPLWVGDSLELDWVVVAPFGLSESRVGAQDDPVCDGADE